MTQEEIIETMAVFLIVDRGLVTVAQLKKYLEVSRRQLQAVGAGNMPQKKLRRMRAVERALKEIEFEQAKYRN